MRVCNKHFKKATEVLESKITGEEFDLCPDCQMELREILNERAESQPEPEQKRNIRPGRPPGRPKTKMA